MESHCCDAILLRHLIAGEEETVVDKATERALTVRVPAELHEALRRRAEMEERSVAQLIRLAARLYVDPDAQPPQGPVVLQHPWTE